MTTRFARIWAVFASKKALAILVIGLIPIAGRLALLPVFPKPVPAVHDEFSYLFAAKTFLLGRMANPTPPLWIHFEPFHILSTPTYTSIFPAGQGLLLAFGKLVLGDFWYGVCLGIGVMCACLTWMLYGWLPPRWAVLGGLLAALQFGFAHYWMNGYWGGQLAAIGGCLILGSLPRLKARLHAGYSLLFGLGVALLANSRPFEGLVLCAAVLLSIAVWLIRFRTFSWRDVALKGVLPAAALLAPVLLAMAAQFQAATGSPIEMPHELYRRQVGVMQTFVWQPDRPVPAYHHDVVRKFFVEWEPNYEDAKDWGTWKGLLPGIVERGKVFGACYFPDRIYLPIALISVLAAFTGRVRLLGFYMLAAWFGTALVHWLVPHYVAPVLGAMMAVHVQFLRLVHAWKWRSRRGGRVAFAGILGLLAGLFLYRSVTRIPGDADPWAKQREHLQQQLEATAGRHLVFVRYSKLHILQDEWVFNEPDMARAKVIWARVMGPEKDGELIRYFVDREFWVVDADAIQPALNKVRKQAP